jgi:hypothetical protein
MLQPLNTRCLLGTFLLLASGAFCAYGAEEGGALVLNTVGCNATALAQVPGTTDLFLGRQLLTAEGQIAGATDCSGGTQKAKAPGKTYNHWALTLVSFNWTTHTFTLLKPLLDTSIDAASGKSRAQITGGPMKGALIRSAYDPAIVRFDGTYFVVFECTLESGSPYPVSGTSSCVSVYDPVRKALDLNRTQVLISGDQGSSSRFTAAAVPALLSYQHRLFLYWSALRIDNDRFSGISIRGAELQVTGDKIGVKGATTRVVHAVDASATAEVWAANPKDPMSSTTADLRDVWATSKSLVAAASVGGAGCTAPSDHTPGCFRLKLVRFADPLPHAAILNELPLNADTLPSNAQEYSRPIQDPSGAYWLIGHYIRPAANGVSDAHPMPSLRFWQNYKPDSVLVMYPLLDHSLWPIASP